MSDDKRKGAGDDGRRSYIDKDGTKVIPLSPQAIEVLQKQKLEFIKKFGREPKGDEPIFFDPAFDVPTAINDTKLDIAMMEFLIKSGAPPEVIFAYRKTERVVLPENRHLLMPAELAEWDAAIAEYFNLNPKKAN
jgi:hypothetical protein